MTVLTRPPVIIAPAKRTSDSLVPAASRTRPSSAAQTRSTTQVGASPRPSRPTRTDLTSTTDDLLRQRSRLPVDHPDRERLRTRVIEANLPLARHLARRYAGRGELLDDLYQVASLALIRVVDRYDPARETAFSSYAIPSILGEIKRHFRDSTRGLRIPRGTQDLSRLVATATSDLSQQLGHSPTTAELARHLHVTVDDVVAAITAARDSYLTSLTASSPASDNADPLDLTDLIGGIDPHYARVDDNLVLRPLLALLSVRDRRILAMRFYANMTQVQIAAEVGLSQMHVSRLLTQSLTRLRTTMLRSPSMPHVPGRA
jgi:RNA polymerase sigma-B factor